MKFHIQMSWACALTKKHLYNFDPLKPHFYIVKLEFTVYNFLLILLKNIECGYSLEPPQPGNSNGYPCDEVAGVGVRILATVFIL